MKIGSTIQSLRKKHQLTQAQLAKELQMSRTTITNYENDYSCPDLDTLVALAKYFNVSTDYLLSNGQIKDGSNHESNYDILDNENLRFWRYFNRLNIENKDFIVGEMIRIYKEQK